MMYMMKFLTAASMVVGTTALSLQPANTMDLESGGARNPPLRKSPSQRAQEEAMAMFGQVFAAALRQEMEKEPGLGLGGTPKEEDGGAAACCICCCCPCWFGLALALGGAPTICGTMAILNEYDPRVMEGDYAEPVIIAFGVLWGIVFLCACAGIGQTGENGEKMLTPAGFLNIFIVGTVGSSVFLAWCISQEVKDTDWALPVWIVCWILQCCIGCATAKPQGGTI